MIKPDGIRLATVVFMVSHTGIDGSDETVELLRHLLLQQWSHATVNDVSCNEDEVRMFAIDHIYPPVQFLPLVVIAQMEVAHHHQSDGALQRFLCV